MVLFGILLRGVLLGLAIAAPVGPIALLCIRRTLISGRWIGLASGAGAATADGFYGAIAAFGLTAVSTLLSAQSFYLKVAGGLFLCYLGAKTFLDRSNSDKFDPGRFDPDRSDLDRSSLDRSRSDRHGPYPATRSEANSIATARSGLPLASAYFSTLVLTLTNPATIFSFIGIFASLGITQMQRIASVTLVCGVFTGSLLWWLVLTSGIVYLRSRLVPKSLARFNQIVSKVAGGLIFGFGLVALVLP